MVWYKILHIPYQMHKLDKSQTEMKLERQRVLLHSVSAHRIILKKIVMLIIIIIVIITIILSNIIV